MFYEDLRFVIRVTIFISRYEFIRNSRIIPIYLEHEFIFPHEIFEVKRFSHADSFDFFWDFIEARDKALLAFETSSLRDFILGKCIVRGLIVLSGFFEELTFPPPSYFPFLMTFVLSLSVLCFDFWGAFSIFFHERFGDLPWL